MAEEFFVTNKGIELITQAIKDESKVEITKVKFGNGGVSGEKDYDITALKNETYSKDFDPLTDSYKIDESDGKSFVITTLLPAEEETTINEIGYFDSSDNLIIYGTVREIEKIVGVPHTYINWVKFDNIDDTAVEITVVSPEYEKVEQLLEKAEKEFNLDNYVKIEDLHGIDLSELVQRVTTIETDLDGFLEVLKETVM